MSFCHGNLYACEKYVNVCCQKISDFFELFKYFFVCTVAKGACELELTIALSDMSRILNSAVCSRGIGCTSHLNAKVKVISSVNLCACFSSQRQKRRVQAQYIGE